MAVLKSGEGTVEQLNAYYVQLREDIDYKNQQLNVVRSELNKLQQVEIAKKEKENLENADKV